MSKFNLTISFSADSEEELNQNLALFGLSPSKLSQVKAKIESSPRSSQSSESEEEEEERPAAKRTRKTSAKEEPKQTKRKAPADDEEEEDEKPAKKRKITLEDLRKVGSQIIEEGKEAQFDKILRKHNAYDEDKDVTRLTLLDKEDYEAVYEKLTDLLS